MIIIVIYIYNEIIIFFNANEFNIFMCVYSKRSRNRESTNLYNRIKKPFDYLEEFQAFKALNYIKLQKRETLTFHFII